MSRRLKQLFISGTILFSSYFSYDIPAALNRAMHFGKDKFTSYEITILYAAYSFPNIFLPILFIWIIKYSEKKLCIFFAALILAGQIIFTLGIWRKTSSLMIFGRFLFGIGNESVFLLQRKINFHSFSWKKIGFCFSLIHFNGYIRNCAKLCMHTLSLKKIWFNICIISRTCVHSHKFVCNIFIKRNTLSYFTCKSY